MPLNKELILFVRHFDDYLCFYFADGHYEMRDERIQTYMKKQKGYKKPICVDSYQLYPTKNIHDKQCCWVHLDVFEQYKTMFMTLLGDDVYKHMCKMYLKYKQEQVAHI